MDQLTADYIESKNKMTFWKAKEAELRIKLLNKHFADQSDGTKTSIDGQVVIKGSFASRSKLDVNQLEKVYDSLSVEEQSCIAYKPTLSMKEYKMLEPEERKDLDFCITVAPSMPTIQIKIVEE